MSRAQWINETPRTLRVWAAIFWVGALACFATVALAYVGEPPEWNRIARLADASELALIGLLLSELAASREKGAS